MRLGAFVETGLLNSGQSFSMSSAGQPGNKGENGQAGGIGP